MRRWPWLLLLLFLAPAAHAVLVRGKVTDTLGHPLPGSHVQLIRLTGGSRNAGDAIAGVDGGYELSSDLAGRFLLLTSPSLVSTGYAPQVGNAFYGGRTDVLTIDIELNPVVIVPVETALVTGTLQPLAQLSAPPAQVYADQLLTHVTAIDELRPLSGVTVVQLGQVGTPARLLERGAPVDATLIDGIPAESLGGDFNLSTVTSIGLSAALSTPAVEVAPDADPLQGMDAQAGVLSFTSPRATSQHPVLVYTGDAGNLSSLHNEATFTIAHTRSDALLTFGRFNTDNDEPAARLHLISSAANLGYRISANTGLRLTLRDDVSAAPAPSPFAFYGVAPLSRLAAQNLYGSFTFETRTAAGWHNLLRYGLVRERSQQFLYASPSTGVPVTITGANGFEASGTAGFLPQPARQDFVTDRDLYTYQTDYGYRSVVRGLLTATYDDERGAYLASGQSATRLDRPHLTVAGVFAAQLKHRLFAQASGFFDHAAELGDHGSPRLGLTYVPVRAGERKFRGTSLHVTAATGFRELSPQQTAMLGTAILPRSRTFDVSADQSLLPRRLSLRATYFHDVFTHQVETIELLPLTFSRALAYREQGLESELRFQPGSRMLFAGGYTYLASLVLESAATASNNPDLPGVAIGATTALSGNRPFDRPSSSGFALAEYNNKALSANLKATFASRSDGTTALVLNPTLLLPNHNLSPGYASLDAAIAFNVTHAITLYTQLTNLADQRSIAPAGYRSTPLGARVGLRIRLGRE